MARSSKRPALGLWLNGIRVGRWSIESGGVHEFNYDDSWLLHPLARPISLSLPLAEAGHAYRGQIVSAFFDNLLPDSREIRQRIGSRYAAASLSAFDLLAEIGRDCVGAISSFPKMKNRPVPTASKGVRQVRKRLPPS